MITSLRNFCLCFSLCIYTLAVQAQRQQLLLVSENDSYTLKITDRYYTNGIALRYSKAIAETGKKKKLLNIEAGQSIFTAYDTRKTYYYRSLDRPYTGFLYAKGGLSYLYNNENVFRWNIIAGVTGEAAKGQEVQKFVHHLLGFKPSYGWESQLRSDVAFNVQASYYQHLLQPSVKRTFDAFIATDAMIGTTFTKISVGAFFRTGAFEPSYNSAWWDGRINRSGKNQQSKHHELFFYFEPSVVAQVYNATIQGGLFANQEGRFISDIQTFIYQHKFGLMYARKKCTMQLGYTYRTKEAKTMIGKEVYGTIAMGYRF
jgi:lipid A 3-O-deacylase